MIVVDASAGLSALVSAGQARRAIGAEQVHVPHLIDSEIASGLRRQVFAGRLDADAGWTALDTWRRLGMTRYPVFGVLGRVWELRDNLSAYAAAYVALAELQAWAAAGVRGELTLVVAGWQPQRPTGGARDFVAEVLARESAGTARKEAIAESAKHFGVPKREVYDAVVAARGQSQSKPS